MTNNMQNTYENTQNTYACTVRVFAYMAPISHNTPPTNLNVKRISMSTLAGI